jgi:hypothetical protein
MNGAGMKTTEIKSDFYQVILQVERKFDFK